MEAAQYAKSQIDAERDRALEDRKNARDSDLERSKSGYDANVESAANIKEQAIKSYADNTNRTISRLQEKLSKMSSAEKARNKGAIQNQILSLRNNNAAKKAKLTEQYNKTKNKARASYQNEKAGINTQYKSDVDAIKSKYEETYLKELDSLKADSQFTGKSKSSKSRAVKTTPKKVVKTDSTLSKAPTTRKKHRERDD